MFSQDEDKSKNEFAEWCVLWNGVIFGGVNVILTIPLPLTLALFIILMFKITKVIGQGCDTTFHINFTVKHTHSTFHPH